MELARPMNAAHLALDVAMVDNSAVPMLNLVTIPRLWSRSPPQLLLLHDLEQRPNESWRGIRQASLLAANLTMVGL
jgi:hypothetical protein